MKIKFPNYFLACIISITIKRGFFGMRFYPFVSMMRFCTLAFISCCSHWVTATPVRQVIIYPTADEGMAVMEAVSQSLAGYLEIVPFDTVLKIRQSIGDHEPDFRSFVKNMGVDYVLSGHLKKDGKKKRFVGAWFDEASGKERNLSLASDSSYDLTKQICAAVGRFLGSSLEPPYVPESNEVGLLYDLGLVRKNRGDFLAAKTIFEDVVDREPLFHMAVIRLAQCAFVAGYSQVAVRALKSLPVELPVIPRILRYELEYRIKMNEGALEEAEDLLGMAINQATLHGLSRRQASLLMQQANHDLVNRQEYSSPPGHIGQARSIYEHLGDLKGIIECNLVKARWAMIRDSEQKALMLIGEARKTAEKLRYPQHEALIYYTRALLESMRDQHTQALQYMSRAELLFKKVGSEFSHINARMEHANILIRLGQADQARTMLHKMLGEAEIKGMFDIEIELRGQLANLHMSSGRYLAAYSALSHNLESLQIKPVPRLVRNTYNRLIPVNLALGLYPNALEVSATLIEMVEQIARERERLSYLLNNHGEILFMMGRDSEASKYFNRSLKMKREFDNQAAEAWTLRNMITLELYRNDLDKAARILRELDKTEPDKLGNELLRAQLKSRMGAYRQSAKILSGARTRFGSDWSPSAEKRAKEIEKTNEMSESFVARRRLPFHD